MNQQYDNTNKGVLFVNQYKEQGDKKPNFTGTLNVGGDEYAISAWERYSDKTGDNFFSLSITPKDEVKPYKKKESGGKSNQKELPF